VAPPGPRTAPGAPHCTASASEGTPASCGTPPPLPPAPPLPTPPAPGAGRRRRRRLLVGLRQRAAPETPSHANPEATSASWLSLGPSRTSTHRNRGSPPAAAPSPGIPEAVRECGFDPPPLSLPAPVPSSLGPPLLHLRTNLSPAPGRSGRGAWQVTGRGRGLPEGGSGAQRGAWPARWRWRWRASGS